MAVESFYWLKSSHSGFFFRIFITRTAKIVRILHKWYFTTYIFSVDVKDLNPLRKLELWQGSLSCEQCAGLFCTYWVLQALVQELCPCISVTRICLLWQQFGVFLPHLLSYLLCKNTFPSLLLEWLGSLFLKNMSLVGKPWKLLLLFFYCRFEEGVDGCSPHSTSSATIRHCSLIHLLLTLYSHQSILGVLRLGLHTVFTSWLQWTAAES